MEIKKRTIEDIANEYVTQNNRGTAFPIAYICIEKERIYKEDGEFVSIYLDGEADSFNGVDDKEILQMVLDYNEPDLEEEIKSDWEDVYDGCDLQDFLEKHYSKNAEVMYYDLEYNYKAKQMFLTESSAKAHIKMNGHNMCEPQDYGIHVFRNIDMEIIVQNLIKKATLPQEEWSIEARHYYKYAKLGDSNE